MTPHAAAATPGPATGDRGGSPDPTLAAAVARADWRSLVPPHRVDGDDVPTGEPFLVDALPLGQARWLAVVADDRWRTYPVPLVTDGAGVRRAGVGEGAAEALLDLLRRGSHEDGAFVVTSWHAVPVAGERPVLVDQTNESVVVGERAVAKWCYQAEPGPHPAPTLLADLVRQRFTGTPQPWGFVEWQPAGEAAPRLVASVVGYLPDVTDGWTWAVDDLRRAVADDSAAAVVDSGTAIGELVAQLHLATAFHARPASDAELAGWRADAEAALATALELTSGATHALLADNAARLRTAWAARLTPAGTGERPLVTRVHGDLHVGQLLRQPSAARPGRHRYVVTDFDGNPVVAAGQRLALQPAALDVAGMVQSLQHVGLVLCRHEPHHDPEVVARMTHELQEAFLAGYRATLTGASSGALLDLGLVLPFRLQQVCREFTYAATHLPRWDYVPTAALPALLDEAGL